MSTRAGTDDTDEQARRAVGDLLVTHSDDIDRTARAFSRTAADADDLAQDVRVRALRFAHYFKPGSNFGGWMRTMTRNLAINRTSSASHRPVTGSEASNAATESAEDARAPNGGDDRSAASRTLGSTRDELPASLALALDELPDHYREVLVLWSLGGQEYKEISATLGIPVGTVMSRLHRGRAALRKQLAAPVGEPSRDGRRDAAPPGRTL